MTKREYLRWKNTGFRHVTDTTFAQQWVRANEADQLIKRETLKILEDKLSYIPGTMRKWILTMASVHFGSVETDEMLTKLKCYPDWM